jgi:hypothetical protein
MLRDRRYGEPYASVRFVFTPKKRARAGRVTRPLAIGVEVDPTTKDVPG